MKIDPEKLKVIIEKNYQTMVLDTHGQQGLDTLKDLLSNIRLFFRFFSPEHYTSSIIIFKTITDSTLLQHGMEPIKSKDLKTISTKCKGTFALQIEASGTYLLFHEPSFDPIELSKVSIVYKFFNNQEFFFSGGQKKEIPKLHHTHSSCFAIPMFYELRDALHHYSISMIKDSSCPTFNNVWHDEKRIYFKHAQEHIIRKSLTQYLKTTFRGDCEVRAEQNMDESHPVDIKITWSFSQRLALIEIKWLGTPCDGLKVGKPYSEHRARDGAKQLSDYLDSNRNQSPYHITRGYLVVIDGRRRGINQHVTHQVNRENAFYFESKEISYNPKYHELRNDFEEPIRMFAEPLCN